MSSIDQAARNTEQNMRKGQEAAQETWSQMESSFSTSVERARDFHLKMFNIFRSHAEATFDLAEELISAKSPDDVSTAWRSFADRQVDAINKQTSEFTSMAQNAAKESIQPVKDIANRAARSA
jgi:hypothetical protein